MEEARQVDVTAHFRVALLAIVVVYAAAVLPFLGRTSLWRTDEARIAEIARQMSDSGDWVVPRIGGETYSRYPPLQFWLLAASGRVLGFDEFSMRLPGALASVILLLVQARLARRLAGPVAGTAAALVLASTPGFLSEAATCRANLLLALCATFAMERFVAVTRGDSRRATIAQFWVALALGALARGPAGLVVPGLGVLAWLACSRGVDLRALEPRWGIPLFAALALAWYVLVARREGFAFLEMNLLRENVEAFASGFEHPRPFWYHLAHLPLSSFPWILLAPLAWRARRAPGVAPAFAWSGLLLLFLTLASNKRASYLSWFHPAYALALGVAFPACGLHVRRRIAGLAPIAALSVALAGAIWGGWIRPRADANGLAGIAFCREIERLVPKEEPVGTLAALVGDPAYYLYLRRRLETRPGGAGVYLAYVEERDRLAREGRPLRVLATHRDSHGRALLLLRIGDPVLGRGERARNPRSAATVRDTPA